MHLIWQSSSYLGQTTSPSNRPTRQHYSVQSFNRSLVVAVAGSVVCHTYSFIASTQFFSSTVNCATLSRGPEPGGWVQVGTVSWLSVSMPHFGLLSKELRTQRPPTAPAPDSRLPSRAKPCPSDSSTLSVRRVSPQASCRHRLVDHDEEVRGCHARRHTFQSK